jgi:hypothetical protein
MMNRARAKAARLAQVAPDRCRTRARDDEAEEVTEKLDAVTLRAHRDRKIGPAKARAEI